MQANSEPWIRFSLRFCDLIELFKDVLMMCFSDANAEILYADHGVLLVLVY